MNWAERRVRLLNPAAVMSVDEVFATLLERDAVLWVDGGDLRYVGPDHGDSDPLRAAIDTHRVLLTEMFTYAPDGRCVFTDCYRLRAPSDPLACSDCRAKMDATPMPWESR